MKLLQIPQVFLRGLGQIMLQPCAATGVLFLVGITLNSPLQAVAASIGCMIGSLYGWIVARNDEWLSEGLFGFNGALVGLATGVLFGPSIAAFTLLIIGCIGASALMHLFLVRRLPAYTAPFVLASWIVTAIGRQWLQLSPAGGAKPGQFLWDLPGAPFTGIGQVMFQREALSGVLFLIGIMLCPILREGLQAGRAAAVQRSAWTFIGALSAGGFAWLLSQPLPLIAAGIFGFNGALAALAVSLRRPEWWPPAVFALLTVPLMIGFQSAGLPAFTAPFVLVTWLSHIALKEG